MIEIRTVVQVKLADVTEFVLFSQVLENSVLPMGLDSSLIIHLALCWNFVLCMSNTN